LRDQQIAADVAIIPVLVAPVKKLHSAAAADDDDDLLLVHHQ